MWSTKVVKTLWVRQKRPVKSIITLDTENVEGVEPLESARNIYIKVEMLLKV